MSTPGREESTKKEGKPRATGAFNEMEATNNHGTEKTEEDKAADVEAPTFGKTDTTTATVTDKIRSIETTTPIPETKDSGRAAATTTIRDSWELREIN